MITLLSNRFVFPDFKFEDEFRPQGGWFVVILFHLLVKPLTER